MISDLTDVQLLTSIWAALRRIEDNMALPPAPLELPAPQVHVAPPDLADIVTAVTSLKPGPTAEEIARAIADVVGPPAAATSDGSDALGQVARALENLDFRLKGMGVQAYGGGSVHLEPADIAAISGLTDAQLRAAAVLITGSVGVTGQVEIANDVGNPIPVRQFGVNAATVTPITSSATVVTLLAANMARNQATIYNESTQTLYVKFGSAASATDYTLPIAGSGYFEFPVRYLGIVTGVWASANGFARVTEF